jgi:phosphate transport system substrate-binding protein
MEGFAMLPKEKWLIVAAVTAIAFCAGGGAVPEKNAIEPQRSDKSEQTVPDSAVPEARLAEPKFTVETYPRVDGSSSTQPLSVLVACRLTGTSCVWGVRSRGRDDRERRLYPLVSGKQQLTRSPNLPTPTEKGAPPWEPRLEELNQVLEQKTTDSGTHESYINLIEGKADLVLNARKPSEDELRAARDKKVELELQPVALDAFVLIVHGENRLHGLTAEQVRDIYTRKIVNWKEVGGPNKKINAYQRERNSGSQETMESLVMNGRKLTELASYIVTGMAGPFNVLQTDQGGIGYTFYYYERFMSPLPESSSYGDVLKSGRRTKILAIDGIAPDSETIRSHKYPFATEVYLVCRKGLAAESSAGKLRDWFLSPAGQAVVKESGYIPVR